MDIICASICYRGFAEDEVSETLIRAPQIGYTAMEIHGPMTWSVEAAETFDVRGFKARLKPSGMHCAGIYSPGWGGADADHVRRHAQAIARLVEIARELGADHVTSTGASQADEPGALERVADCLQQRYAAVY